MDDLKKCRKLLSLPDLKEDWFRWYGLTKRRKNSIFEEPTHPNSIFNPNSETTLTLFLLGNLDRWSQTSMGIEPPRDRNSRWNRSFFQSLVRNDSENDDIVKENSLWDRSRLSEVLDIANHDLNKNILLFELELYNDALHLGRKSSRDNISFLDLSSIRKWIRYDAVLILPNSKIFVFFESKFKSDVSANRQNYPYTNQIIKGLESAHLLTEYEDSPYRDWDFRYMIICPKLLDDYHLTRYNKTVDVIGKYLVKYNDLLNDRYSDSLNIECYPDLFESFVKEVPEKISKLYWKDLGGSLTDENQNFFSEYFRALSDLNFDPRRIKGLRKKFKEAGVHFHEKDKS